MTAKDKPESPFPPPVFDSEDEQEQTSVPSNPEEYMHGILDELGFR